MFVLMLFLIDILYYIQYNDYNNEHDLHHLKNKIMNCLTQIKILKIILCKSKHIIIQ